MDILQAIILAVVQGITEFLPVSSSAHLILVPMFLGWPDQGIGFDIAVHVGTLLAILYYFRVRLVSLVKNGLGVIQAKTLNNDAAIFWGVMFATIPVGLCGLLFKPLVEMYMRSALVLAAATIGFGILLGVAEGFGNRTRTLHHLGWRDVIWIGLGQALALIPGTSRSGITMTVALFLGFKRKAAAEFSFLMAIPVIALAGGLQFLQFYKQNNGIDWTPIIVGTGVSFIVAFATIHFFMRLLDKIGFMPFVWYRVGLGLFLLYHIL